MRQRITAGALEETCSAFTLLLIYTAPYIGKVSPGKMKTVVTKIDEIGNCT